LAQGNEAFVEDFTLARLPGISHWVLHDAPDAVTAAITEWAKTRKLAQPART